MRARGSRRSRSQGSRPRVRAVAARGRHALKRFVLRHVEAHRHPIVPTRYITPPTSSQGVARSPRFSAASAIAAMQMTAVPKDMLREPGDQHDDIDRLHRGDRFPRGCFTSARIPTTEKPKKKPTMSPQPSVASSDGTVSKPRPPYLSTRRRRTRGPTVTADSRCITRLSRCPRLRREKSLSPVTRKPCRWASASLHFHRHLDRKRHDLVVHNCLLCTDLIAARPS